jgi:hypothetical protein
MLQNAPESMPNPLAKSQLHSYTHALHVVPASSFNSRTIHQLLSMPSCPVLLEYKMPYPVQNKYRSNQHAREFQDGDFIPRLRHARET